jgi:flagellar biosynthetic protein FliO
VSAAVDPRPLPTEGYGAALAQTLITLVAVCALAWWALRWGARRGLGGALGGGRVEVLDRTPLDARSTLFVVRIGKRVLVLGAGPQSVNTLAELRDDELPPPTEAPRGLAELLFERARAKTAERGDTAS